MSFYLDDYADDDDQPATHLCPNCSGSSFYNDPITGTLTCSSCYTQSQTDTQEELDYEEGMGIAATGGGKRSYNTLKGGGGMQKGRKGRPLTEYDGSQPLPDVESCCLAFQWLLWDASKCVSKLAGIQQGRSSRNNDSYWDTTNENNNERGHSILERTVKKIWFTYLQSWKKATRYYSSKYPEMRVSFRDYFLEGIRKSHLLRHLSVTVGRKVEEQILDEMQTKLQQQRGYGNSNTVQFYYETEEDDEEDEKSFTSVDETVSSNHDNDSMTTTKSKKRKRHHAEQQPYYLTIHQLCKHIVPSKPKRHPNGLCQLHPRHAILKIQPSLTLLLSILQLALNHCQAGVAPHHLTSWVANGKLPHGLNAYAKLPRQFKERVKMVKKFFARSFVPPASAVADLTDMLATACCWYGETRDKPLDSGMEQKIPLMRPGTHLSSEIMADEASSAKGSTANSVASGRSIATTAQNTTNNNLSSSHYTKSLYNVPLLAARMVQDFGFDQKVLNNTLAIMGVVANNDRGTQEVVAAGSSQDSKSAIGSGTKPKNSSADLRDKKGVASHIAMGLSKCTSPDKLHTPLHVAAVIVLACKLCPGWETWKITNPRANVTIANSTDSKQQQQDSSPAFVIPWNEAQFVLLGNGPTLNHYMDFLEDTVFNGMEPSTQVAQYFQSLKKDRIDDITASSEKSSSSTKNDTTPNKARIKPNIVLSGASNPNEPTAKSNCCNSQPSSSLTHSNAQWNKVNNIGRFTSYQYHHTRNKNKGKVLGMKPYHPHYCRLLEYICYIIEEPNSGKLHNMVEELGSALFI